MKLIQLRKRLLQSRFVFLIFLTIVFICVVQNAISKVNNNDFRIINIKTLTDATSIRSLSKEIAKHRLILTDSAFIHSNETLETTIKCVGSLYNQ